MKKLILVSDNHSNLKVLEDLFSRYGNREDVTIFHLGDSEFSPLDPLWPHNCLKLEGNCDYYPGFAQESVYQWGDWTIFASHGHRHGVNYSFYEMQEAAQQVGAQLAFHGHTHIPHVDLVEGVLVVNPGSIAYPRGAFRNRPTYAVLEADENKQVTIQFMTPDHQLVEDMTQVVKLEEGQE